MRKLLRGAGWTFIGTGCFVLYFLVYQLWGTNLTTGREQSNLRHSLQREWTGQAPGTSKLGAGALPVPRTPALGKALGVIEIPKIQLEKVIVQGADPEQLAKIVTRYAIYTYRVSRLQVVAPTAVDVLDNVRAPDGKLKSQLVLTTCNPRFSAAQRLIVFGDLSHSAPNTGGLAA